ncbi:MAG: hypothetical protein R6V28_07230 [Nitriliruptoraceae bacterium]
MSGAGTSFAILVIVSLLTGCSDSGTAEDPAIDAADAEEAPDATQPADAATDEDEPDTTGSEETSTDVVNAGSRNARVEVGDEAFDFRVIQCLRYVPGLLGGIVTFQLDGVPGDTPPELVEPLLGAAVPDSDIFELLGPVLEYGPILSVTRVEDGGDYIAVSLGGGEAYVSDDSSSGDQPLTIGQETAGAVVTGRPRSAPRTASRCPCQWRPPAPECGAEPVTGLRSPRS